MVSHRAQSAAGIIRNVVGRFAREIPPNVAQIVSITEVEVSSDLGHATVYVRALTNVQAAIEWMMKRAKRELKPLVAKELNIFTVPSLRFVVDERPDHADRIEQLLK